MIDYSELKVSDIKNMLVSNGLITEEEAKNIKGKGAWVGKHQELMMNTDHMSKVVEELEHLNLTIDNTDNDSNVKDEAVNETIPESVVESRTVEYTSPEWSNFVMSFFKPNELHNGNPTVQGLRRVAELLLGRIVISGPIDVRSTMTMEGVGKAVVIYELQIEWKLGIEPYITISANSSGDLPVRVFRATASSWSGNTDDEFAVFPEAMAETRAEGRALRKALRVDSVCAEEITGKDTAQIAQMAQESREKTSSGNWPEDTSITDHQTNTINVLCDRLNIDVLKFINLGDKKYESLEQVQRSTAANMIKHLNKYQSTGEDSVEIPKEIMKL